MAAKTQAELEEAVWWHIRSAATTSDPGELARQRAFASVWGAELHKARNIMADLPGIRGGWFVLGLLGGALLSSLLGG